MRLIISPEQRAEITSLYLAGDRPKNIAAALGINDWNVSNILRRAKRARCRVDAQKLILARDEWIGNRRYTIDHSAFSAITPDAAYWCGFLMADGCIRGNKARIKLAPKDRGHLEKFRAFVKTDAPIMVGEPPENRKPEISGRVIRSSGSVSITVASKQIVCDLAAFGITPRKTFTACARCGLEVNRDFWRGVIDGDGTLAWSKNKPYIGVLGSEVLMAQYLAFCKSITQTNTTVRPDGNVFRVFMNCRAAYEVIHALYSDATTSLDRKAAKAAFVLDEASHYQLP